MQPKRQNAITTLTAAAAAIAAMPSHERGGWIAYLVEAIEAKTPEDDAAAWITDAIAELTRRLNSGAW